MENAIDMKDTMPTLETALDAYRRGYTPIPILYEGVEPDARKRPGVHGWQKLRYSSEEEVREKFSGWIDEGMTNIGLLLGEPSSNLVDVDLDHPKAIRLRDYFLPPTPMVSGRDGRPSSHLWYVAKEGTLPGTRQHKLSGGEMAVELRSTKAQTLIAPSIHSTGENYRWEKSPWGGELGPLEIDGRVLSAQVALTGLGAQLLDAWPSKGFRHETYLALAGALLSNGDIGVHPFWERNARPLIRALASASLDDPDERESEVLDSTIQKLKSGKRVVGFGKLRDILGDDVVRQVRILIDEVESAAGFTPRDALTPATASPAPALSPTPTGTKIAAPRTIPAPHGDDYDLPDEETLDEDEPLDPLDARTSTWEAVDAAPYLDGTVRAVKPSMLLREDGQALMYPGRVNMLFGNSESAKSWIALKMSLQAVQAGQRVVYLDFEDEPVNTFNRLLRLGGDPDELLKNFFYVHPEDPLAEMQRDTWGKDAQTDRGRADSGAFERTLIEADPALIIADGMTVLYGLHGLNTNDSVQTDVITSWLKRLTHNGRSTVVVIDHSGKDAEKGSLPIGSQHKVSMVQGTLLQAYPVRQPMPDEIGEIELVVLKDRPGEVRRVSERSGGAKAQVCAVVVMDSKTVPERTDMTINPPARPVTGTGAQTSVGVNNSGPETARERRQRVKREKAVQIVDAVLLKFEGSPQAEYSMPELVGNLPADDQELAKAVVRTMAGIPRENERDLQGYVDQWLEPTGSTRSRKYRSMVLPETFDDN